MLQRLVKRLVRELIEKNIKLGTFAFNKWALTPPKLPKVVLFLVKYRILATEKATKNQRIKELTE